MGCTEPVALALAASAAVQASAGWTPASTAPLSNRGEEELTAIRVKVSRNIFKNAFAIIIPNSGGRKGIVMSVALGVFCDPRKSMGLFHDVNDRVIDAAETLVRSGRIHVSIAEDAPSDLFIDVEVETRDSRGRCVICEEHSRIQYLERDGKCVYGSAATRRVGGAFSSEIDSLKSLSLSEVMALVEDLPAPVISLLRETVEKNLRACNAGVENPLGIGTGYLGNSDETATSVLQQISSLAAAGSDARMAGFPVEIMTSGGSGNQGIVATIPIVEYARLNAIDELRMLKALALSHLMTMYLTTYLGYLSALCGVAIKAGVGAACGLVYAMGGTVREIERAIKIMSATLTGMICDGAKVGCALKVGTAADMALRAATLAMQQADVPEDNGIVSLTAEQTIKNLSELSRSMEAVDQKLVEIMIEKIS